MHYVNNDHGKTYSIATQYVETDTTKHHPNGGNFGELLVVQPTAAYMLVHAATCAGPECELVGHVCVTSGPSTLYPLGWQAVRVCGWWRLCRAATGCVPASIKAACT